jgi:hypothetical protein
LWDTSTLDYQSPGVEDARGGIDEAGEGVLGVYVTGIGIWVLEPDGLSDGFPIMTKTRARIVESTQRDACE